MKTSLKQILLNHLKENCSLNLVELEQICHEQHYKQSCAERRLRELSESGLIRPMRKGGYISAWVLESNNCPLESETTLKKQNLKPQRQITWESASALIEKQRQLRFLNK